MKKNVTRKDVAKLANVSETIVSYVINNNRYVDKDKKARVLQAIEELQYRPNPIARSLKGKNSYHILFIADQIDNEHFGKIVKEIDNLAYEKGYLISLVANRNDKSFIDNIISRRVDGIIINSASFKEQYIDELIAENIPVVLIMMRSYTRKFEKVGKIYTGVYNGVVSSMKYLVDSGRKNILYIDRISRRGNFSGDDDLRLKGFLDAARGLGLKYGKENVITGCSTEEEAIERIVEEIKTRGNVDGIIGRNDNMSLLGLKAVERAGKTCPGDIAIIGFDNSRISEYTTPRLTTVEIDRKAIAASAIEMLCAEIAGEKTSRVSLETKLIVREST